MMTTTSAVWEPFVEPSTALLTSYRRDGTPVTTPVDVAVDGGHAYFRTWDTAGKAKRLRRDPEVEVVPRRHRHAAGTPLRARARLLSGDEVAAARHALARKHPIRQSVLVPAMHRLRGYRTVHYELEPER